MLVRATIVDTDGKWHTLALDYDKANSAGINMFEALKEAALMTGIKYKDLWSFQLPEEEDTNNE